MSDHTWDGVRPALRPTPAEEAEYVRLVQYAAHRGAQGLAALRDKAHRLYLTDPLFRARVALGVEAARNLQAVDPEFPADPSPDLLRQTGALMALAADREVLADRQPDAVRALSYALHQLGGMAARYREPNEYGRQALQVLDALGYEVRPKTIEETPTHEHP